MALSDKLALSYATGTCLSTSKTILFPFPQKLHAILLDCVRAFSSFVVVRSVRCCSRIMAASSLSQIPMQFFKSN